jgi:hypothetical protein
LFALRLLGGIFAAALLISTVVRYRRQRISRLNLLISTAMAIVVGLLAVVPSVFDPLFRLFNFDPGGRRRLLGLSLLANLLLFVLVLRNMGQTELSVRNLSLLVQSLSVQAFDWSQTRKLPDAPLVVVVMPARNEAQNVGDVVRGLPQELDGHKVVCLVVDDASEDETSQAAREAGALVARLPIRRGGGMAMRVGYEIALRLGAAVVVSMDADGQHLPSELPRVVGPILRGEADMVQGSRMLGEFERESRVRHLGVVFFSRLVFFMTRVPVTDVSNGYRATRGETLKKLVLRQDQFWTSELLIEGWRQHARILEVPVTVRARSAGASKKPRPLRYGWNFAKAIFQTWLR